MQKYLLYLLLFLGFNIFMSCKKDKLKSPTASYIVVKDVSVKTLSTQGSNSQKITDMWYYVNGDFKGIFPVGGVMPIVATDNAEITLFAGIKNNGISSTRVPYKFYKAYTFTQNLDVHKTYTITPIFEYISSSIFVYSDGFDGGGTTFTATPNTSIITDITKTYGNSAGCIYMSMTDADPIAKITNSAQYYLPAGGSTVYVEVNYKCNQPFVIGILGDGVDEREAITVNPSEGWNKIYVSLTSIVSAPPNHAGSQLFIKATKQVANPQIYIDNVKLITE